MEERHIVVAPGCVKVGRPQAIKHEDYERIGKRLAREAQQALDAGEEKTAFAKGDLSSRCTMNARRA